MRLLLPLVLLIVPIIEITFFILIGQEIGLFWTLAMVLVTAIAGTALLRIQGFAVMARIQQETRAGRVPGRELAHGLMLVVAGIFLLTPGFFTDTLGFLLFWPPIRDGIYKGLKTRLFAFVPQMGGAGMGGGSPFGGTGPFGRSRGDVVDLDEAEYVRREPDPVDRAKPIDR